MVLPETHDYRRASIVHTCTGENFLEIGCDFGCTVDRVQNALLQEYKDEKSLNTKDNEIVIQSSMKKRVALGIDKSQESISIAQDRYPHCLFSLEDALTKEGSAQIRSLCQTHLENKYPSVVSIDINGNRELPAVLECIERIMCPDFDNDDNVEDKQIDEMTESQFTYNGVKWDLPRLIVVKSRTLHELLVSREKDGYPLS